jgi:HlyD family secretion protein
MNMGRTRAGAAAVLCAACAALACAGASGCDRGRPEGFAGSGTLEATEVVVSAQTAGQIMRLAREEGEAVAVGDTLARIDVEKLMLQRRQVLAGLDEVKANRRSTAEAVRQAEDNLENLTRSFERISGLHEKGTATQQQYDDASTKRRIAQSALEAARAQRELLDAKDTEINATVAVLDRQIRDGSVVAPCAGVIVEKYFERGELVPAGGAIYRIADTSAYWLKVYVAEKDLGGFKLGETATVRVDAYGRDLAGAVSWVSSEAEFTPKNVETKEARAELVYAVKIMIHEPPAELKIGMPAEVYLK